jgi:hypothetical protein
VAIKAVEVLNECQTLLGDITAAGTQYLVADLKKYLNEGQREIVKIDPQANAVREPVLVVPGPDQEIPSNSLGLIAVVRNMGRSGTTEGDVIRKIDRKVIDDLLPDWHTATAKETVKFYIYDPVVSRDTFDIFPPAVSTQTHWIEIIHGELPEPITDFATTDILHDRYYADLVDYVLFRAKSMHAEYVKSGEAALHWQKFEASVKAKA